MGKFVRKKATADSEQLLTPRKNGFFGKRNNGVRSEDPEKPKPISALRLVSSVFGGSKHKDTSKELSPLDGTPDIRMFGDNEPYLASMNGTPKTAPPSPDLVVTSNLRRDSPTQNDTPTGARAPSPNDNGHTEHTHKQNGTGAEVDGDETVMSDLTGTVSPTPHNLPLNGTPNHPTSSNSVATPHHATRPHQTAQGVTFASTPRRQDDSYYSGYSPSLSGFDGTQKDDGNMNGDGLNAADPGVDANDAMDNRCKSSVLDQMLGVVDSACHRTMDLTLGNAFSGNGSGRPDRALSPQWGMAPSRDDDESTCFDTMGGTLTATLYTRDTGTATYTRDTATATATLPTHDTGSQGKNQDSDDKINRSGNVRALGSSAAENQAIGGGSDSMKKPVSLSSRWTDPEEQLHENFELVLGKNALTGNYGEESSWKTPEEDAAVTPTAKKRGWGSRILNNGGDNFPGHKKTLSAGKLAAAGPEEEKKDDTGSFLYDQRPAQTKVEVGNMQGKPPLSPSEPVAYASFSPSAAAAIAVADNKNVGGVERSASPSPSHDVGVEIQSRRVIEQQEREKKQLASNLFTASFASKHLPPPSPKTKLSSLVKKLRFGGKGVRRAKSTSQLPPKKPASPMKRAFSRPSSPVAKAQKKGTEGAAGKGTPATLPSVSKATKNAEEEKTEIEPPLDATLPTTPTAAVSNVSKMEGQIADDDAIESKPKSFHPEIAKLPPKPFLLPGRSNSFRLSNDAAYDMDKTSADAQAADLTQPVTLNRLRSAPQKLASSEALEEEKKEKEEEFKTAEPEGEVKSDEAQQQGNATKDPATVESPKEEQGIPPCADTAKTTATAATAAATTKDGPSGKAPKLTWKAAVDDQGRTYYYHRATRNTTWSKPPEFDAEMAAVKKYKEELEAARKEASEMQQVVEGCESVAAIQANLRKTTDRDFDPQVWETKQEILGIVRTMPLPKGTNIEKLLIQYDGREEQLLANLRDLVESKPFDEPFQVPKKDPPANVSREYDETPYDAESPMNTSNSSSVSSANLQTVEVQSRVRTAVSASTRISEKTNITEKTEKIRNTSKGVVGKGGIGTIRESASIAMSTGSISSATRGSMPPRHEAVPFDANPRVPSKIPVVPRSRDLKVEEFTSDRIAKETFNGENTFIEEKTFHGENALPEEKISLHEAKLVKNASKSSIDSRRSSPSSFDAGQTSAKAVAEKIVALSALDDDDSYNGDYDDDDRGTDTASEKNADSISALSEHDADYLAQKENFERARRRALDVALEREDWDLAAALSEGMKQVKESLYGAKGPQREWTQTELDRFISENDWDAVSKYIAHMRNNPSPAPSAANKIPNLSAPRGIEPGTGRERDPDGFVSPKRITAAGHGTPPYVSEATKRASAHTINGRRQQRMTTESSVSSSQGSNQRAQTRFGARSQLQHSDLDSIQSWDSSSSYDSEYTDNSYESEEEQGYISLRRRRPEFEC